MDSKKLHCALWLQSCSRTHKLWCDCGIWTSHIKGWRPSEGDNPGHIAGDVGDGTHVHLDGDGNIKEDADIPDEG
nr:ORF2 [Torque teno felis virus]